MPKLLVTGAAALILAVAALIWVPHWPLPALQLQPNMAQAAATTIAALATIALILERALAAFNDLLFGQERTEARQQLNAARLTVPPAPPTPASLVAGAAPTAAVVNAQLAAAQAHAAARATIAPALAQVEAVDLKRERARLILGFAAAFLISAAGVRTLASLVTATVPLSNYAQMVDILLTAGLLAGGSNALAKLVDLIQEGAGQKLTNLRTTP